MASKKKSKTKQTPDPRDSEDWDWLGEFRAGMNAVYNGGPTTFNGQPILGLYIAADDPFLKKYPEVVPYEDFEGITLCEWWGCDWDDDNIKWDQYGDTAIPNKKFPAGSTINAKYLGNERFYFLNTQYHPAPYTLSHPTSLGGKQAVIKGKIDDSKEIKYGIHFKKK